MSMHFLSNSIGGKYFSFDFSSFLALLGYFLVAFGEIILFKIMRKKKKVNGEPRTIVEVEEGRNAAAVMVVVEEESVNARVATVGVIVLVIFELTIHSFYEGIQIGQQSKSYRHQIKLVKNTTDTTLSYTISIVKTCDSTLAIWSITIV